VDNSTVTAVNDGYSTNENTTLTVAAAGVLANDSDSLSNPITVASNTSPSHGTLTLNTDGSLTYTPNTNFHGTDSFTYQAKDDGGVTSNTATVTITVIDNSTVTAVNDSYGVNASTGVTVLTANSVLANDSDSDGDALTVTSHTSPSHGTLTINADGSFTYTPDSSFASIGTDSFTYTASDAAGNRATATVTLFAPVVHAGGNIMLDAGDQWTRTSGLFTDSGASSGFTVTVNYGDASMVPPLESNGSSTTFTLSHTWTTPGTYTVTVTVMDSLGGVGTATFTVIVNAI
jgi:VCBS repeat-containing protein